MPIVVAVRIPDVDIKRVREVEKSHAHLTEQVKLALKKHGCTSHQRLYRDREIMDIDQWESEEGLRAFLEEMMPVIRELSQLRGTGKPVDTIWQIY